MQHKDLFNLFHSGSLYVLDSTEQVDIMPLGPKVIITTPSDLCLGLSRSMFIRLEENPRNAIIFLNELKCGSLGRELETNMKSPVIPTLSLEIYSQIVCVAKNL